MRFFKDEDGQALVIVAAFMGLAAIGFLAFAIDVGYLFREKRMAQAAADGAALAAAEEMAAGNLTNEYPVAAAISKMNGFDTTLASNPATVVLTTPLTGNFVGPYVQATVSRPIPTMFLGAFSRAHSTVPVSATAIAGGSRTSQNCVCLEGGSGEVLNLSNNSKLTASGCGIVDNSSSSNAVGVVGSSTLTALTLATVSSTWDTSSNINNGGSIAPSTTIVQGIASGCSPTMPTAPTAPVCLADPGGSYGTFTFGPVSPLVPICYTSLTVGANGSTCTLNPGIYIISSGNLHFESGSGGHSNLGGNGVFFYLKGTATVSIDNGANVNLVAGNSTTSGGTTTASLGSNYDGIVVFQATGDTSTLSLQGGSTTYINGALYAPSAGITVGNGSGATLTGGIVAQQLTMNGGGTLTAVADTNQGSTSLGSAKIVQ